MCTAHESEGPRLPSALLKEGCAYSPSKVKPQVAKLFSMLAYFTSTVSTVTRRHTEVWASGGNRIQVSGLRRRGAGPRSGSATIQQYDLSFSIPKI